MFGVEMDMDMSRQTEVDVQILYCIAADQQQALAIGQSLVDARLAACVNILGPMTSIYRWEDKTETSAEVAFIVKTTTTCVDLAISLIKNMHSYELPCIVTVPVSGGCGDFLSWIRQSVAR